MPLNLNNHKSHKFVDWNSDYTINGLDNYLKFLEFHYFSEVSLRNYTINNIGLDMTLDINCPINLLEMLGHFNKNRWGKSIGLTTSPLQKGFEILTKKNNTNLDIEELTLILNDTSIVIKKISEKSILHQFNDIITELANHYIYFTKGLTEKPYEIFVPVFEDNIENDVNNDKLNCIQKENNPQSYFEFWGIYLDSLDDALIYDLNKNAFIPADLDLSIY